MKLLRVRTNDTLRPLVNAVLATTIGINDKNHPAIGDNLHRLGLQNPTLLPFKAAELLVQLRPTITMAVA
jgi:hypothetical protein